MAIESDDELHAIRIISSNNLNFHSMAYTAMTSHCVTGSYMKLNKLSANVMLILAALKYSKTFPVVSHEDKMLIYTVEKLKSVRVSVLLSDYHRYRCNISINYLFILSQSNISI